MRRRIVVILGLLLLLLLILWLARGHPPEVAHVEPPVEPAAPPGPPWALVPPPQVAKLEVGHKADRSHVGLWMLEDANLPMVVADSLIVSRFPRDSMPLTKFQVDQLEPNRRFDSKGPVTHKDLTVEPNMQVLFTGDKFRIVGDQSLLMTLALFKDDQPVPVSIVSATARAKSVDSAAVGLDVPVTFSDRGDLVQMATLQLTGTPIENHAGRVDVDVQYDPGNGKIAQVTLDALYQPGGPAPARFTGKFREVMNQGSLDIYAGVEVTEAGPYMISANLFDAARQPAVSMLARMVQLAPGTTEVKLEAFGRVVREQSSPSPFTLSNLRGYLFYPGKDPDRKTMPDYMEDYQTAKYPADAFSDDEYWDQHKQNQVQTLLDASKNAPAGSQMGQTIGAASAQGWKPQW